MLLQNVCAAGYALLSRNIIQRYAKAHFQVLAIVFGCLYMVGLCYVASQWRLVYADAFAQHWWRYIGGGLLFGVWTYYSYLVFQYVDAAIASLLSLLNILAVVFVASVSIHESLSVQQLVGSLVLLGAMAVIFTARTNQRVHNKWFAAISLSLVASCTYGLAIANEKWLLNHTTVPSYIVYGFGWQFLVLLVMSLKIHRKQFRNIYQRDFRNKTLLAGVVRGGAGLLFIISLVKANNASLISVLSGFKVVLTTLAGAIFLHETKLLTRKYAASIVAMAGIAIMLWK